MAVSEISALRVFFSLRVIVKFGGRGGGIEGKETA